MKTNGARFLETLDIRFELQEYEVDVDDLSAIAVAKKIGMPPEQVFKTLLTTGGTDSYVFAVIPGDAELDFKSWPAPLACARRRWRAQGRAAAYRLHSRRRDRLRGKEILSGFR